MSFNALSTGGFLAGLATLAAILFALQRLRVRHRSVQVVTTLFWREATMESRARVFVQRFRHPWAYLLVLMIAGLLWTAVAGPERSAHEGRSYALLLDASASMQRVDAQGLTRFDQALEALKDEAARLPRARTRVILCDAQPRALLLPGEELLLLRERLRGVRPTAAPSTVWGEVERLSCSTGAEQLSLIVQRQPHLFTSLANRGREHSVVLFLAATAGEGHVAGPRIVWIFGALDEKHLR